MEETEEEKKIPDITPEQEAAWNGPGEAPSFDEEDPPCTGYDNACECDNCLMQEEAWNGPGEAPSFDEEYPPCTGYDNACECDNCLMQEEDEFWKEEDEDG